MNYQDSLNDLNLLRKEVKAVSMIGLNLNEITEKDLAVIDQSLKQIYKTVELGSFKDITYFFKSENVSLKNGIDISRFQSYCSQYLSLYLKKMASEEIRSIVKTSITTEDKTKIDNFISFVKAKSIKLDWVIGQIIESIDESDILKKKLKEEIPEEELLLKADFFRRRKVIVKIPKRN